MSAELTAISTFGWFSEDDVVDNLTSISNFGWYAEFSTGPVVVDPTWDYVLLGMLRNLIGDRLAGSFSDERLEETLVAAAQLVIYDTCLYSSADYTISFSPPNITPDPVIQNDKPFMHLVTVKAACMLDQSTVKISTNTSGVRGKVGHVLMGTSQAFGGLMDSQYCEDYQRLKNRYECNNVKRGVMSPFINENFIPTDYKSKHGYRR